MTDGAETDVVGLLPQIGELCMADVLELDRPVLAAAMTRLLAADDGQVIASAFQNFVSQPDPEP